MYMMDDTHDPSHIQLWHIRRLTTYLTSASSYTRRTHVYCVCVMCYVYITHLQPTEFTLPFLRSHQRPEVCHRAPGRAQSSWWSLLGLKSSKKPVILKNNTPSHAAPERQHSKKTCGQAFRSEWVGLRAFQARLGS